jgi:hypothetical protein
MSLWTRTQKPKFAPHSVASRDGWTHPVNNETLETFGDGASNKPAIPATIVLQQVTLYKKFISASGDALPDTRTSFSTGDYLEFAVRFNGQVYVTGGTPYLEVIINGVTRHANYVQTGWGPVSATLIFVYRIAANDVATPGNISIGNIVLP